MVECRMGEPPNPLELAQAIAAMPTGCDEQTALLCELVAQGRAPRPEHHHQPPAPGYPEFLATQPPLFLKADEPLEVDSWLRTIESKFTLHPYNDGDKAGLAAQQLRGPGAHGGRIMWQCSPRTPDSLGLSSRRLSERTICQRG